MPVCNIVFCRPHSIVFQRRYPPNIERFHNGVSHFFFWSCRHDTLCRASGLFRIGSSKTVFVLLSGICRPKAFPITHDSTVDDRPENELTGSTVYVDGSADRKHAVYAHNIRSKLMRTLFNNKCTRNRKLSCSFGKIKISFQAYSFKTS